MRRPIEELRRRLPGTWRYDAQLGRWFREEPRTIVSRIAEYAPRYDGDDDNFESTLRTQEGVVLARAWKGRWLWLDSAAPAP